jgi:hypothetical protein
MPALPQGSTHKRETPAAKGTEHVLTTNLMLRNSSALAPAQQAPAKPGRVSVLRDAKV